MEQFFNPYTIDPDTLTLGELVVMEGITGWTTGEILAGFAGQGVQSPKFLLALRTIAGSRQDGSYRVEDAMDEPLLSMLQVITDG